MCVRGFRRLVVIGALAVGPGQLAAQEWEPIEPFQVTSNIYFVGNSSVAVWLITGSEGHVLLDTGYEAMVPEVVASIEALGFDLADIRFLAHSHAHYDHVGGHAAMKELLPNAEVMAVPGEIERLEAGGLGDPVLGDSYPFPPVEVDRELMDAEAVVVGDLEVISYVTAGHTEGCTSWTTVTEVDGEPRTAVFVCSLSILGGTQLIDPNSSYLGIAQDYRRAFQLLRGSGCEVFLGSHGSFFGLEEKLAALRAGAAENPFVDPEGCMAYVDESEERFLARYAEQEAGAGSPQG